MLGAGPSGVSVRLPSRSPRPACGDGRGGRLAFLGRDLTTVPAVTGDLLYVVNVGRPGWVVLALLIEKLTP